MITLPQRLTKTVDYGINLKFAVLLFNAKDQKAEVVFETIDDLGNFTGAHFRILVDAKGTLYMYPDGSQEQQPVPVFSAAGVQNIIAINTLEAFAQAKVR